MQQGSYPIGSRTINVNTDTATGVVTNATCDIPLNKLALAIQQYLGLTLPIAVASGGTGATTQSQALTNILGASTIPIANGGTGASTSASARSNLGAAASGANSDITSLSGLTTPLSVAQGGTGASSAGATAANNIGALAITNNLSDLNSPATARTNLGLGTMATQNSNAVTITGGSISGVTFGDYQYVSVRTYGASAGASAATNLTAFKNAVAATPSGGTLIVPNDPSGPYIIDCTGGLSTAITVANPITIRIEGTVKSNYGVQQANPPYIFRLTGNNVTIDGMATGSVQGPGTFDTTNSGDDTTMPGLIRVEGNNCIVRGLTVNQPPKIGIQLYNNSKCSIYNCNFTGGPNSYVIGNTAHFGIRTFSGSYHSILNNKFYPDAGGGIVIDGVFSVSTINMLISGNSAISLWEKLVYLFTSNSVISNNTIDYPSGNQTDCIRVEGSQNVITGNWVQNAMGGVTILDGNSNIVSNNKFIGCKQVGIFITQLSGAYTSGFGDTQIIGNYCTAGPGSTLADGISILGVGGDSSRIVVSDNVVIGFGSSSGQAQIRIQATSPNGIFDTTISGNDVNGNATGPNGIWLGRGVRCRIDNNIIRSVTTSGISCDGCSEVEISDNLLTSPGTWTFDLGPSNASSAVRLNNNRSLSATNVGVNHFGTQCTGQGNQYTDTPLNVSATLAAAVTTTVTHGGVAPNATIIAMSSNTSAGLAIVSKGQVITAVSGNNFTITNPNGAAAAGTETYTCYIVQ